MTEQDWLTSDDPQAMLTFARGNDANTAEGMGGGSVILSDRKLRLLACAIVPPWEKWHRLDKREEIDWPLTAALALRSGDPGSPERNSVFANLLRDIFGNPFRPVMLPHSKNCPSWVGPRTRFDCGCVCDWLTLNDGLVRKIAQTIYDERRFEDMPILADALEEAGCKNEEMLNHCRELERCPLNYGKGYHELQCSEEAGGYRWACGVCDGKEWIPLRGPHVRGCWVVDLLLGKE